MALATTGGTLQALLGSAPSPQIIAGREGMSHQITVASAPRWTTAACSHATVSWSTMLTPPWSPSLAAMIRTFMPGFTLAQLSTISAIAIAACFGIRGELTVSSDPSSVRTLNIKLIANYLRCRFDTIAFGLNQWPIFCAERIPAFGFFLCPFDDGIRKVCDGRACRPRVNVSSAFDGQLRSRPFVAPRPFTSRRSHDFSDHLKPFLIFSRSHQISQMEHRPWPHPGVDGPAAGRADPIVGNHLRLVCHDTNFVADDVHQPDELPRVAMAVFHTDNVWTFNQSGEHGHRNSHFVIDRIVIDKKAHLGKHLGDLSIKVGHVLGRLRVVIGYAEQCSIAADILDKLQPFDDFPHIRTGCADEQWHTLLYRVDSCHCQSHVLLTI